ncbi:hypothetical protein Xcel_1368 [Xylanimonas cellulosilytica DSM 15894]|uniref:Uncharacterized protein n=2 Tax=Xylanimonas TaxID=186188 RepID=D1BRE4_XYLCX|nr:hypothetical protein Xcel_1368 [Xylanimonas cellulosilytica DSM 15894]
MTMLNPQLVRECADAVAAVLPVPGVAGEHLLKMLADFGGVDTLDSDQVLTAAAAGMWAQWVRNTDIWENAHAGGRLSDGEMFRTNAASVLAIREALAGGSTWEHALDLVTSSDRVLPDGRPLRKMLPSAHKSGRVHDYATTAARRWDNRISDSGLNPLAAYLAVGAAGAPFTSDWHGMPKWEPRVRQFVAALIEPEHPHWGGTLAARLNAFPGELVIPSLEATLLENPAQLSADVASWCVSTCALGYLAVTPG